MKFLLLALLCVAAASAYTGEDLEFALYEDAGILAQIRERIQKGFEQAVDRIKALIEKHKPLVEDLKERLATLKEKVKDLATQTGQKFREAVRNIREKSRQLIRDILKKVSDGVESVSLYDDDDEQTPFQQFIQRVRERVQAAFEKLRELVAKHKETISVALKEKIEQVKQKLAELALEHGANLLEKAREVASRIREVLREVIAKIGIKEETALYAVEEDGETFLQALKRRIVERLQKAVEQIKEKLTQVHSDFAEKVLPKLQEIKDKIKELAQESGAKLLETAGKITQRIREIFDEMSKKVLGDSYYYADTETIVTAAKALRDFFTTNEGIAALKKNAAKANPTSETGIMFKAFILSATPDAMKDLISELFKGLNSSSLVYADNIKELVKKAVDWLQTDEGINQIRAYAGKLETTHPVVLRLKDRLGNASNDEVRTLIKDIFTIDL